MYISYFIKAPVLAVALCTASISHAANNLEQVRALLAQSAATKNGKDSTVPIRHQRTASMLVATPAEDPNYPVEEATDNPFEGEAAVWDEELELDNSGMLDGLYLCNISITGEDAYREAYISVNGKSTGETVFIIGDVMPGKNPFFGYGTGYVFSDAYGDIYAFQGATSANHDFSLTAQYDADGIAYATGEVTITFKATAGSQTPLSALAQFSCVSLW